jgi:hypothetical protein
MDCHEAREKLNRLAYNLLEIQEEAALRVHLDSCPDCARLITAEQLLIKDFKELRMATPGRFLSIDQVRQGILIREKRYRDANFGVRVMQEIRDVVYTRPRLSLVTSILVALLIASMLVPVRTRQPVGYEVVFAAPVKGLVLDQANARRMLAALDLDHAELEVTDDDANVKYRIAPLKDSTQIRKLIAAIDSLGGRQVRDVIMRARVKNLTIWELLLTSDTKEAAVPPDGFDLPTGDSVVTIDLRDYFGDNEDFVLWIPDGERTDSVRGLLMSRHGNRTEGTIVGTHVNDQINECGWNKNLENADMHTRTPDGEDVVFHMYDIDDVRKLEKMGYNFATMTWDKPGQVPIPGMGPELSSIKPNPFSHEAVISFMLPQAYEVKVAILNKRGYEVRVLRDCISLAGIFQVIWDGRDEHGNLLDNDTYTCRFTAGDYVQTKELQLRR